MSASRRDEDRTRLDGFELEIFKLVREGSTSKQWREWLRVPLEHAAAEGNLDLFTRLMDAGANGSAGWQGCYGRTLLGAAAYGKSEEMVLTLLKAGAMDDVNLKFGYNQESALHVAAACGADRASNALMLAGADPNVLNVVRQSPLHLAAKAGHDGVVNNLLLKGADPKMRAGEGQTPLHLAAARGHALCVSKLVIGGADKDSRDRNDQTPLHLAARDNRLGAVEELLAAGANVDLRREYGVRHVDLLTRLILLRPGNSASSSDPYCGCTALHLAAGSGGYSDNGDVIRVLLEAGADIEAKTTDQTCGRTPLHIAVRAESSGNVRALLKGGARASSRDASGFTPLHDACSKSLVGAVEALLCWGADEKLTGDDGRTAEEMLNFRAKYEENNQRIQRMLERAPADRSWRRRRWLVLARSCPAKVQLAHVSGGGGDGGNGSSTTIGKASRGGGDRSRDETADLARLVGRVIGLDVEGVFRLVVGFL